MAEKTQNKGTINAEFAETHKCTVGGKMNQPKCRECEHNPMGICELCDKEIPMSYITGRAGFHPAFCPMKAKK